MSPSPRPSGISCRQIDKLVTDGKLTPALMLTTAKMYMSVKESPYVEEEVKDIMAHLYWRVRSLLADVDWLRSQFLPAHLCGGDGRRAPLPPCR